MVEGDVADLVDDQQPVAFEPSQLSVQASGLAGGGQPGDPRRRGVEEHRVAGVDGLDAQRDGQVGLADPGWPEQDQVVSARDEGSGGQVGQHVASHGRLVRAVPVLQGLDRGEVGTDGAHRGAACLTVGDLTGQDGGEVLLVAPPVGAGDHRQLRPGGRDRGGLDHPGEVGRVRGQLRGAASWGVPGVGGYVGAAQHAGAHQVTSVVAATSRSAGAATRAVGPDSSGPGAGSGLVMPNRAS